MAKLTGKGAVVLGAAARDNMGQHIARRFAAEGARVLVAGRHRDELERLAGAIGGHAALCDITRRADVFALAATARKELGHVDIAVNATGWGLLKPFLETTEDEIDKMNALQLRGPFFFLQAMIQAMDRGGSLIQISSATAKIMLNDHAAYMATKAGADHLVRCAANEFGARGIRVNSISPGLTVTPMTAEHVAMPGLVDAFVPSYPLGRIGTSADIAAAAVWLASDECFMTGENLQVNGGLCLRRNPTREEIAAAVAEARQGGQDAGYA
ncbi:MAG: SDR family oxidoreductase [Alphaproteobacteria bacterium]|nr:MAG: SDR family oxidoreductase [Alphaproteobacteria bacterium]